MLTHLNTNWVTATIAKPTFVNQFENEKLREGRSLGVDWVGFEWEAVTTGALPLDDEDNSFLVQISEGSVTDLMTTMDLTRTIMKAFPTDSGFVMVSSGNPLKVSNHYEVFLTLTEKRGSV